MKLFNFAIICVVVFFTASCQRSTEKLAHALYEKALDAYKEESYEQAEQLIDSLHVNYPNEISTRRKALALKKEVDIQRSRRDSLYAQTRLSILQQAQDSLAQYFVKINDTPFPDEYILSAKELRNQRIPYLDIYFNKDGELELIASVKNSTPLNSNHLIIEDVTNKTFISTDTLPYDAGMNYRYKEAGVFYERLTFTAKDALAIAQFITHAPKEHQLKAQVKGGGTLVFNLSNTLRLSFLRTIAMHNVQEEIGLLKRTLSKHTKRLQQYKQQP